MIIYNLKAYSIVELSNAEKFHVGDTIKLIKPDGTQSGRNYHLYLFADVNSCSLCMSSIKEMYNEISTYYDIEIILFVGALSNEDILKIKSQFPSNWKIVSDEIFAYKSYFKVNQYPFYYVLDEIGTIVAMDKAGGELDAKSILNILNNINKEKDNNPLNSKMELDINDSFIYAQSRYLLYSPISENIYMLLPGPQVLLIYTNKGKLVDSLHIPLKGNISFYDPDWYEEPYSFIFVNNSYSNYREYLTYDIRTNAITQLTVNYDTLKASEILLHYRTYFSKELNQIFTTNYTMKNIKLDDKFEPFIRMGISNNKFGTFGKLPEYYKKFKGSQFLYSTFLYDNFNKLLLTNINNDDKISFWNLQNYSLEKEFSLNNQNNNIDKYEHDLYIGDDIGTKIDMFSKVQYCQNLYQLSPEVYALTSFKLNFINNNFNDYNYSYKVIIFNFNGDIIKTINLEMGLIPFYISDKFILCSKYENKSITIAKIKLN